MDTIRLKNADETIAVDVLPNHSGSINRFMFLKDSQWLDIIDGYSTDEELVQNKGSKSSLLAPFPNRTRDGKFNFNEKEYQLPINKPNENNSIHGFLENENFKIEQQSTNSLILSYHYNGSKDYFPFSFKMSVSYSLLNNKLTCTTEVENTSKVKIPFGFGWHPYFKLGATINDLLLQIPSTEEIDVDDRLLPTGKINKHTEFQSLQLISNHSFDTGFVLSKHNKRTILKNENLNISLEIEIGEGYEYLQIYTPPHRETIAIEPMTCETDALNSKKGLKVLRPEEVFSATYSIKIIGTSTHF